MDLVYNGVKETFNITLLLEARADGGIVVPRVVVPGSVVTVPDSRVDLIDRLLISGYSKVSFLAEDVVPVDEVPDKGKGKKEEEEEEGLKKE